MNKTERNVMLCFYKGNINNDISILEDLDSKGFEVHLFNDIDKDNLDCSILLSIIKDLFGSKSSEYNIYISSNIKEFIMVEYILYGNWISGALYINNNPVHIKLDKIYEEILNQEIYKYTKVLNFYVLKDEDNIFNDYCIFSGNFKSKSDIYKFENKIYRYMDQKHVFSINNDKKVKIVDLDNSGNVDNYRYYLDFEWIDDYIKLIDYYSNYIDEFINSYGMVCSELNRFKNIILNCPDFEKNMIQFKLDNNLYNHICSDISKILLSSDLLNIFNDKKYLEFLLELLIKSTDINKYNRFFAYYQCVRYIFVNKDICSENIDIMIEKLYEKIFNDFYIISEKYTRIEEKQRNHNKIFIVTNQFLGINHAPTKIAIDCCYNFIKNLNKEVFLINTKEVLTEKGIVAMSNIVNANVINEYNNINILKYKDLKIQFYQPQIQMPDENEIVKILNMIEEHKPSMVINIGTTLVGDLCTKIVPTVTIPLGSDGYSKSMFYVVNDKNERNKYIKKHNRSVESLIISKFQFELKQKEHTFTKEQLGIPQNKFIIAVIGNRLEQEIDEECLELLEKSCKINNSYVLFIDEFNFNGKDTSKYKNLVGNHKNMGYQQDLLAVLEHIDIYVNPKRSGGGTSAIYAMYLGKPVVTLNYGDVANNVGEKFIVENYDEMEDQILKYKNNDKFYQSQSIIAKKTALGLVDNFKFINTIYEKIMMSELF